MEVGTVQRIDIEQKMRSAYLSFAMSVITARALPDVRDGLKPVQRRILYAMHDMGIRHDEPTRKCARIVGEVMGKYHPHGDAPIYESLVRMAQDFTMRYVLVDGQGNFGSVDGDEAAAMRYTEARLSALGEEMLLDLDKNTVEFIPNFDASLQEPAVLPAKLPNLLINGTMGIAVGMATNIPPHNLGEVADAIAYLIDRYDTADDVTLDELMQFIQGPDFPTSGTILGREGIRQAYATGKGRIIVRAQAHIEDLSGGRSAIIITELPYQVNKSSLVERIAELVRNGRLEGIGDLRDESDRGGMRVVVELKRGIEPTGLLSQLLKMTQMQTALGMNMLALADGVPRVLPLKRILLHYIEHRHEVIVRRTRFELEKAQARAHILEGLLLALDNLDAVIDTIRRSRTAETAQQNLMSRFKLTEIQARAILDMQLRRLAALERRKLEEEHAEVRKQIEYLRGLLASKKKILALIKEDVLDLKRRFGDARRTRILEAAVAEEFRPQDMLPDEDVIVSLTRNGAVRRLPVSAYRGPQGIERHVLGPLATERDVLQELVQTNTRAATLFFSDKGRAFKVPTHQLPDATQQARGAATHNLVSLGAGERVVGMIPLDHADAEGYLCLATRQGKVKRLALEELSSLGSAGAEVIGLAEDDRLGWVVRTRGGQELIMVTARGRAIRFKEDEVRPMGRSAGGVIGIGLADGDSVAALDVVRPKGELVLATAYGFAKRASLDEYPLQGRGGVGVLTTDADKLATSGPIVAAKVALPGEELLLGSTAGAMQRVRLAEVPALARASWGRVVTRSRAGALLQVRDDTLCTLAVLAGMPQTAPEAAPGRRRKPAAPQAPAAPEPATEKAPTRQPRATERAARKRAAQPAVAEVSIPEPEKAAPKEEAKPPAPARRRSARAQKAESEEVPPPPAPKAEPTKPSPKRGGKTAAPEAEATPPQPAPVARTRRVGRATVTQPPRRSGTSKAPR